MNRIFLMTVCLIVAFPLFSKEKVNPAKIKNLLCFWDFNEQSGKDRVSAAPYKYALKEGAGKIERVRDGFFGKYAAEIREGQWFYISRAKCPVLNIHGKEAQVTVAAWVKRKKKNFNQCEAVAG
ncbi:MAG: hypothetical protein PHS30_05770, partial [Bacteroidales bacterium]|nr:hypothetical protein [Bacteroidales bacterium]